MSLLQLVPMSRPQQVQLWVPMSRLELVQLWVLKSRLELVQLWVVVLLYRERRKNVKGHVRQPIESHFQHH
jgi:hypothetical protein